MSRFDVRRLNGTSTLAVELQSNLLEDLNTRLVAPLVPRNEIGVYIDRLNPVFHIRGAAYVMMTQHMAAVPVREMTDIVCSLRGEQHAIVSATDFLFQGF